MSHSIGLNVESLLPLFSITIALMLGAISPGPAFIYVAKIQLRFHENTVYLPHWVQAQVQHSLVF